MGTLYIDRKDIEVRLDGDAIAFYVNGEREGMAPLKPLKRVVISGRVMLESSVLNRLAEENISALFLSGKRQQFKGILHGRLHNNGVLRLKQYEKSSASMPVQTGNGYLFAFQWSKELMLKKLTAQRDFLKEAFDKRPDCRNEITRGILTVEAVIEKVKVLNEDSCKTLRGFEGGAAASYFSAYTTLFPESLGFKKRERRPPPDPVNAVLSLVYTLLHWEAVREIEVIGLDPTIGFYHEFEYGRESLACDLIEPLRPLADRWVWRLFADRTFTSQHFTTGNERPGCYLKKEGRKDFYFLYEEWAKDIRGALIADVRGLAKMLMDGKDGEDIIPE